MSEPDIGPSAVASVEERTEDILSLTNIQTILDAIAQIIEKRITPAYLAGYADAREQAAAMVSALPSTESTLADDVAATIRAMQPRKGGGT